MIKRLIILLLFATGHSQDTLYVVNWSLSNCEYTMLIADDSLSWPQTSIQDSIPLYDDWIQFSFWPGVDSFQVIDNHRVEYYYLYVLDSARIDTLHHTYLQTAIFTSADTCFKYPVFVNKPLNIFIIRREDYD
jgi:hypothetical protein